MSVDVGYVFFQKKAAASGTDMAIGLWNNSPNAITTDRMLDAGIWKSPIKTDWAEEETGRTACG